MLQHIFRGRRSAWFPLLTARRRRFAEFDTSVICHAVLILCLVSFLLKICFKALSILALQGLRLKCEHVAFSHSIL